MITKVCIGRFQVDRLTKGHIDLLNNIADAETHIVLVGVAKFPHSKKNPLTFELIRSMIQENYSKFIIVPVYDMECDKLWSEQVDSIIKIISPPTNEVEIYHSRDSFAKHYSGKYNLVKIEAVDCPSATEVRESIKPSRSYNQISFNAGIIYATKIRYPRVFPCVDVAILRNDKSTNYNYELLVCRKFKGDKYRFIGGFVDEKDLSYEHTVMREVAEETGGNLQIGNLRYLSSHDIKDWNLTEGDSIKSSFFVADYLWGYAKASDDITECKWVDIKDLEDRDFVNYHRDLFARVKVEINRRRDENPIPNSN